MAVGVETGAEATQVPLFSAPGLAHMQEETEKPLTDICLYSRAQEVLATHMELRQAIAGASRLAPIPDNLKNYDRPWAVWAAIGKAILYRADRPKEPPRSYKDFLEDEYTRGTHVGRVF